MKIYINIIIIIFTIIISSCQNDTDIYNDITINKDNIVGTYKAEKLSFNEVITDITITFNSSYTYSYIQNININGDITTVTTIGNWKYLDVNHTRIIMTVSDESNNIDIIADIEYVDKIIKYIIINNTKFIKQI